MFRYIIAILDAVLALFVMVSLAEYEKMAQRIYASSVLMLLIFNIILLLR